MTAQLLKDLWTIEHLIAIAGVLGAAVTGLIAIVRGRPSKWGDLDREYRLAHDLTAHEAVAVGPCEDFQLECWYRAFSGMRDVSADEVRLLLGLRPSTRALRNYSAGRSWLKLVDDGVGARRFALVGGPVRRNAALALMTFLYFAGAFLALLPITFFKELGLAGWSGVVILIGLAAIGSPFLALSIPGLVGISSAGRIVGMQEVHLAGTGGQPRSSNVVNARIVVRPAQSA